MITFEYDNYIRELEQMAAPLAMCITSERHANFAVMYIGTACGVVMITLNQYNDRKTFAIGSEAPVYNFDAFKTYVIARLEAA